MKTYDYTKFKRCFLGNNFDGNFDDLFAMINRGLKKQINNEVHPKELERQERLKKRQEAHEQLRPAMNPLAGHGLAGEMGIAPVPDVPQNRAFNRVRDNDEYAKKEKKMFITPNMFNESVIILLGSFGFGNKDFSFFEKKLSEFNTALAKNNCHILFVRGNDEDPSYFEEEKINFSNIKTLVSNCVIAFNNFNCLCIGGGLSMDREWKKAKMKELGCSYWENEDISIDWDDMKKTLESTNFACVISRQIPTFVHPMTDNQNRWLKTNPELASEIVNSRLNMDLLYTEFIKLNKKPFVWWNAYPGAACKQSINNIIFKHDSSNSISLLSDIVYNEFRIHLVEEDKPSKSMLDDLKEKLGYIDSSTTITWTDDFEWDAQHLVGEVNHGHAAPGDFAFAPVDYPGAIRRADEPVAGIAEAQENPIYDAQEEPRYGEAIGQARG
jgi:hypothetical protein